MPLGAGFVFEVLKDDVGVQQRDAVRSTCSDSMFTDNQFLLCFAAASFTYTCNTRIKLQMAVFDRGISHLRHTDFTLSRSQVDFVFVPEFTFSISLFKITSLLLFKQRTHTHTHAPKTVSTQTFKFFMRFYRFSHSVT